VRFWDTSALIPLVVAEAASARAAHWLREDPNVVVWTLTRVELLSALARRRRSEPTAERHLVTARREILRAWDAWSEIAVVESVRRYAERIVETHALSAADALQIGAALVAADNHPSGLEFVTFDASQAVAAEREGFPVLTLDRREER
jgi:predicted nucleic acid-binding protein